MEESKKDDLNQKANEVTPKTEDTALTNPTADEENKEVQAVPAEALEVPAEALEAKNENEEKPADKVENPPAQTEVLAEALEAKSENTEVKAEALEAEPSTVVEETTEEDSEAHPEVLTDDHHEDNHFAAEELEIPDYSAMNNETLIEEAKRLVEQNIVAIKDHIEALKTALFKHLDDEHKTKLHNFVEAGNSEIDFRLEQPLRAAFKQIYKEYRNKRDTYYKELSQKLAVNLEVKKEIIEEIKELPNKEGMIVPLKYKHFRGLQDRWKEVGPVPKADSQELYNNYHFHVNNFYDFLRISNELREMDFKKNLKAKELLCERAEAVLAKEIKKGTFDELQKLHKAWREIGPADREHSDAIWERFSKATKEIHSKRHEFFEKLKENQEQVLVEKDTVCVEIEELVKTPAATHGAWQNTIKELNALRDKFKSFGPIHHPKNDAIWERFREANRTFNKSKNNFYKGLKKQQHENLNRKKELLARVEEIKNSDAWKDTAQELKRIQNDWKKIGYVPKVESDKIWGEFRNACNHFFNRLTEFNSKLDEKFVDHFNQKQELLKEVEAFEVSEDSKADLAKLQAYIKQWRNIGRVPRKDKEIENKFNTVIDKKFDALKMERGQSIIIRFENKISSFLESSDQFKIDREFELIRKRIDEVKKEMLQLQNNISFFSHVDENNPMVKEVNRQINRHEEQIKIFKDKLSKGRDVIKKFTKAKEEEVKPKEKPEAETPSEGED